MLPTAPQIAGLIAPANWPVLEAPTRWRVVDFISDLHLQASGPETFGAWQHYMAHTRADAVFILGDLFEVWVGDDVLPPPRPNRQQRNASKSAAHRRCVMPPASGTFSSCTATGIS